MGYDLIVAACFVLLTPVVIAGFIVFWIVNAQDHAVVAKAWSAYARSRGLRFVAPAGEWPNRTPPSVRWETSGAELRITTVGKEATVHTRVVVRPRAAPLGQLIWVCDDDRIAVRERPAGFKERMVSDRVERALHALRQRDKVSLSYRRGKVIVDFPGGELNDARLDAARTLGDEIASTLHAHLQPPRVAAKPAA